MKRLILTLAAVASLALAGGSPALAASPQAGQCDGYNDPANTKVDTSDGSIVLAAGLTICIHASNSNTGTITTDGTTSLAGYIEASGLLNEGGQVPNVSNYVVYGVPTPTPTPTPVPTPTPTPVPTPTPTPVPTPTPTPPTGTLFSVPAFSIECGGSITVTNFAAANVDDVLIEPGDTVIDADGTYVFAPGDYVAVGRVDDEIVTDEVPFEIVECPTGQTPTPPPGDDTGNPTPKPTPPATDTIGSSDGTTGGGLMPLLLILGALSAGTLLFTQVKRPR